MKVLIGCECSQVITKEFRKIGIECYSNDLEPCYGGKPEWHIQGDVLELINDDFDLLIAHPPSTYISNAGARWLYPNHKLNVDRYKKGVEATKFFNALLNCKIKHICIENPLPSKIFNLPNPTQIIQPYYFGEPYSIKTLLWLKNLPKLKPTEIINTHILYVTSGSYTDTHDKKYAGFSRKGGASKVRSKSFKGIAIAMAQQWSNIL